MRTYKNTHIYTPDTKIGCTNALKEKLRVLKAEKQELELASRRVFMTSDPNNIKLPEIYPKEPVIEDQNPVYSEVSQDIIEHKEDYDSEEETLELPVIPKPEQPTKKYPNINELIKSKKW